MTTEELEFALIGKLFELDFDMEHIAEQLKELIGDEAFAALVPEEVNFEVDTDLVHRIAAYLIEEEELGEETDPELVLTIAHFIYGWEAREP